ncbi:MAG: GDSL-type esterase/lipase family protein [Candidatus Omnitrophota bacterium]
MIRFRESLARGICVILGTALALVLAEIVARGVIVCVDNPVGVGDHFKAIHEPKAARYLYHLKPHSRAVISAKLLYSINSHGLRSPEIPYAKPPGEQRVLVLGDSVAFGFGVSDEQTFSRILQEQLGEGYAVINAGVGGYNTYLEYEFLRAEGIRYDPDVVILAVCLNDVAYPLMHFSSHMLKCLGPIPAEAYPALSWVDFLQARSVLFRWVCEWLNFGSHRIYRKSVSGKRSGPAPSENDAREKKTRRHWEGDLKKLMDPRSREWSWLRKQILRIRDGVREREGRLIVVVFPFRYQMQEDAYDGIFQHFSEFFSREGIEGMDLLQAFRRHEEEKGTELFRDTSHLNPEGHRLTAKLLAEPLLKNAPGVS